MSNKLHAAYQELAVAAADLLHTPIGDRLDEQYERVKNALLRVYVENAVVRPPSNLTPHIPMAVAIVLGLISIICFVMLVRGH
jgi:hypothetical protein